MAVQPICPIDKTTVTFDQMMQLNFCQDLESPKPAQHSLFYEYLCNMLLFGLGSAVNTAEEEDNLPDDLINYNSVCRATPGFTRVC